MQDYHKQLSVVDRIYSGSCSSLFLLSRYSWTTFF
jgi:hypothetical protein